MIRDHNRGTKQYNLTPLDPASKIKFQCSEKFVIFQNDQIIKLAYPAHLYDPQPDSASPTDVLITILPEEDDQHPMAVIPCDRDGTVSRSDQSDIQVKSELMAQSNGIGLNPTIVNYLKISDAERLSNGKYAIVITYQRAVMGLETDDSIYDGEQFSNLPYSPALMKSVLDRLRVLENSSTIGSLYGTSLATSDILDEDLTGAAPENYVRYERHEVNTPAGIELVQPSKGSFYPRDLEILEYDPEDFTLTADNVSEAEGNLFFYTDTESILSNSQHVSYQHRAVLTTPVINRLLDASTTTPKSVTGKLVRLVGDGEVQVPVKPLKYGVDYVVDHIDIPRTARTVSTDAVYQCIRFITQRTGEVLISYRAFGGSVATDDVRSIRQDVTNTRNILTASGLITAATLDSQPYLKSLYKRLVRMEEFHGHNSQVEHRIGIGTTGWHWMNIATVYDDAWRTAVPVINDVGTFRVQSTLRQWMYEFTVDVDMSRPEASVIKVRTLGTNQDAGNDWMDYSKIMFRDHLAVRLCWIGNGKNSGLMLQIGLDFTPYKYYDYRIAQDTILVTNKSGASSMWRLLTDPDQVNFPADGNYSVYQHSQFVLTKDKTFRAGKRYWLYRDLFLYRRTSDESIKGGKTYYAYEAAAAQGANYYPVDTTDPAYVPGTPTDRFRSPVYDDKGNIVGQQINLFEKIVYGRYPVEEAQDYIVPGNPVPINTYYEETDDTYKPDVEFSMPSGEDWTYRGEGCKCCVRILEPDGGLVAWCGNANLTPYAYGVAEACQTCDGPTYTEEKPVGDYDHKDADGKFDTLYSANPYESDLMLSGYIQSQLDIAGVTKATLVLFDRLANKYVSVDGNVSDGDDGLMTANIVVDLEDLCFCKFTLSKVDMTDSTERAKYSIAYFDTETSQTKFKILPDPASPATPANEKIYSLVRLSIEPFLGSLSRDTERFDLRQVRLHF